MAAALPDASVLAMIERRLTRWFVGAASVVSAVLSISTALPAWPCLLAIGALWDPRRVWLMALSVSYFASSILIATLLGLPGPISPVNIRLAFWCSAAFGAFYAYLTWSQREIVDGSRLGPRLLAMIVVVIAVGQIVAYRHPVLINEAARLRPAVGAVAFGAALLWIWRQRAISIFLGVVIGALGVAPRVLASEWFRQNAVQDPLIVQKDTVAWSSSPAKIGELRLHSVATEIDIAPSGAKYIYQSGPDYSYVSTVAGSVKGIHSGQVKFIDEDRVLALLSVPEGTELRELRPFDEAAESRWHLLLPRASNARLIVHGKEGGWHVRFRTPDARFHWVSGTVGTNASHETLVENTNGTDSIAMAFAGDMVVDVASRRHRELPEDSGWDERLPPRGSGPTAVLSALDQSGIGTSLEPIATMFDLGCRPMVSGGLRVLCLAGDDWESNVWLAGRRGQPGQPVVVEPLTRLDGKRVFMGARDGAVVLAGPHDLVWIDTETRRAVRLPYPKYGTAALFDGRAALGLGSGIVGIVDKADSTLTLYRMP